MIGVDFHAKSDNAKFSVRGQLWDDQSYSPYYTMSVKAEPEAEGVAHLHAEVTLYLHEDQLRAIRDKANRLLKTKRRKRSADNG